MLNLLKLIPGVHYVYAAIIAGLLVAFGAYTIHERHVGADKLKAAVAEAQTKAEAAAEAEIRSLEDAHSADLAKVEDEYETQHAADVAAHSADAVRLRQLETSLTNALLHSSGAGPQGDGSGTGGPSQGEDGLVRLGDTAAELADATRALNTALAVCVADRDALTGK